MEVAHLQKPGCARTGAGVQRRATYAGVVKLWGPLTHSSIEVPADEGRLLRGEAADQILDLGAGILFRYPQVGE